MAIDNTQDQDVAVELSHESLSDLTARSCGCSSGNSELNQPLIEPNYTSPWANWTRGENNSTWHPDGHGTYHMKDVPCRMSMLLNNYTTGACFFSETLQIPHSEGFTAACIAAVILAILLECTRRGTEELDRFLLNDHALQKKKEKIDTEREGYIQERQEAYQQMRGEERAARAADDARAQIALQAHEAHKRVVDVNLAIRAINKVIAARVVAERAGTAEDPPADAAVQVNDGADGAAASGALAAPEGIAEASHQEANRELPAAGGPGGAAGTHGASGAAGPSSSGRSASALTAPEAVTAGAMAQARPPAEAGPSGISDRPTSVTLRRSASAASSNPDAIRPATPSDGPASGMPENNANAAQCEEPGVAQGDNAGANQGEANVEAGPNRGQPPRLSEFLPPEVKQFRPTLWQTLLRALLHSAQFVLAFFLMLFGKQVAPRDLPLVSTTWMLTFSYL